MVGIGVFLRVERWWMQGMAQMLHGAVGLVEVDGVIAPSTLGSPLAPPSEVDGFAILR